MASALNNLKIVDMPLNKETKPNQTWLRCGNNNKDEDNRPKTLNDKNHKASSQKFRQLLIYGNRFLIL